MTQYEYLATINGTVYNLSPIVDSSSLSIVSPLCSNEKKSGNGTASVTLKGGANPTFYRAFIQALLNAQANPVVGDCSLVINDTRSNTILHNGYFDINELTISSGFFPDALNLASKDKMQFLDTKIRLNQFWENVSRNQIVATLIDAMNSDTGVTVPYLSSELSDDEKVDYFSVAEGKEETYRTVIDKLLFEAIGYVLWYDPQYNGFRIRQIPTTVDENQTYRIVKYRVENRLTTQSEVYENDGILLSYPTITERANTNLYDAGISLELESDGTVVGEEVQSGDYYPTDGDVKEIYQEFSVADRAYISKESRLQNEDLKLLYAKNVSYQLGSKPALSLAPAIPSINWNGVAEFYPDRARLLFVNNNTNKSNLTVFSLTGTAVYISSLNKITVPSVCQNPEEYTVETITDPTKAKAFADWFYNSQKFGRTTSRWAEPEGYSTLGEIVMVRHKDTGVEMPHVIVQITDSCAGGQSGTIRLKEIVAISLYGWQEVLSQSVPTSTEKGSIPNQNVRWSSGTALSGKPVVRGFEGRVGDYYLNTETGDIYRCTTSGDANTAMWTWVMNNKGDDADISDMQVFLEYGISTSPTSYQVPDAVLGYTNELTEESDTLGIETGEEIGFQNFSWTDNTRSWLRGYHVWQRVRTVTPEGVETYGTPSYCKDLTQSLEDGSVFRLVPLDSSWRKNLAQPLSALNAQVSFTIKADNFASDAEMRSFVSSVVLTPYKGVTPLTLQAITVVLPLADNTITVAFPQNKDWDSIVATVTFAITRDNGISYVTRNITSSCTFTAVDVTEYGVYGGSFTDINAANAWFNTNKGGLKDGYSYTDTTQKVIMVYQSGAWQPITLSVDRASSILSLAEKDFWTLYDGSTEEEKATLWALYGYKKEIIASAIATERIQMYGQGIIESANIDSSKVNAEGFLTEIGYRFEGATGTLRATNSYISNGKFVNGTFTSIIIDGTSEFHGTIQTNVFETQEENDTGNAMTAVSPNASTGSADAINATEVKSNLQQWARDNLVKSTPNLVSKRTVGNLNLFNGQTADSLIYMGESISSTPTVFKEEEVSDVTEETRLTWTNPFPCSIIISMGYERNTASHTETVDTYDWVLQYTSSFGTFEYPENVVPEDPQEGDEMLIYTDIEWMGNYWSATVNYYRYEKTGSEEQEFAEEGTVELYIDGTQQSIGWTGDQYEIQPNSTVEVVLGSVYIEEDYNWYEGSAWLYWTESQNFKKGVLFFTGSTKKFYLDDMPTGLRTSGNARLDVNGNTVLNCPLNSGTAWTYPSNAYAINKLFNFEWTVPPSTHGLYNNISAYSVTIVPYNTSQPKNLGTIQRVQTTANSLILYGSSGTENMNANTYYRSFNISITPFSRLRGVYSENLNPKAHNTYSLGNSQAYWLEAYISTVIQGSSKRAFKTNVSDFDKSALDIINATKIVNYTYKSDKKRNNHIGFIADDTPSELSGKDKDAMVYGDCIGVLLKAIQELSKKIEDLEGGKK